MKLRPEFESLRTSLLNRNPVPSLDTCFGKHRPCNRLPAVCNRLHSVNSPKLPFLAQARQLSLRRESSSIVQDFNHPGDPFSLMRESLDQARLPGLIL
ncbi:hypothetical protein Lal_00038025 [Lupinus albus]|nr:hypothetical protein Lal_00038025 [Lupinus albus]